MSNEADLGESVAAVMIAKPACLWCHYLVGDLGSRHYHECYGATDCPAMHMQIMIGINIPLTARALADAWRDQDTETVTRVMAELTPLHEVVRERVLAIATSKLKGLS